mmetsp:Transcript_9405/g.36611  ORF Transcript_9405/g.36611 Transcript_9405/m.36611 type:complete len:267 (-) Transcript_9405:362-1162(-)
MDSPQCLQTALWYLHISLCAIIWTLGKVTAQVPAHSSLKLSTNPQGMTSWRHSSRWSSTPALVPIHSHLGRLGHANGRFSQSLACDTAYLACVMRSHPGCSHFTSRWSQLARCSAMSWRRTLCRQQSPGLALPLGRQHSSTAYAQLVSIVRLSQRRHTSGQPALSMRHRISSPRWVLVGASALRQTTFNALTAATHSPCSGAVSPALSPRAAHRHALHHTPREDDTFPRTDDWSRTGSHATSPHDSHSTSAGGADAKAVGFLKPSV